MQKILTQLAAITRIFSRRLYAWKGVNYSKCATIFKSAHYNIMRAYFIMLKIWI
jgi:hypothetical protein